MTWTEKSHQAGVFLSVALAFFIPLSTSITDILIALVIVAWLLAGHYKSVKDQLLQNPIVQASLLFFIILAVGMLYTPVSFKVAGKMLGKYRELLMLVFLIPFLSQAIHRQWAQQAFGLAVAVTLVVALYKYFAFPDHLDPALRPGTGFKDSIVHGFLLAVFSFGLATHILAKSFNRKMTYAALVLLMGVTINLFFMNDGRTGFILYFLLCGLIMIRRFKWKGMVLGVLLVGGMHLGLSAVSATYQLHMRGIYENSNKYMETGSTQSSMGKRLDYLVNSWQLWMDRPVFGHGTGSFESRYSDWIDSRGLEHKTANPHNEYLMIAVQTGLVGLCALLYFIFCQVKYAFRLDPLNRNLALGLALVTAAGCMGNSFFLDHTEGTLIIYLCAMLYGPVFSPEYRRNA